ncbi:MAG TPA: tetratricopeptide repeat protein [Kofleriaceae bacterium]
MSNQAPPRLKHGDEFGPLLRAGDLADVSAERLASNAAGYKALIAGGATTALWKLIVPLLLLVAIAIPAIVIGTRGASEPMSAAAPHEQAALDIENAETHATVTSREPAVAVPEPEPSKPTPAAPKSAPAVVELAQPPAVPPPSELPEQIRIYEDARDAGRRGDYAIAIAGIDDLLRRFPASPLRAEAELTRAELFARGNRVDEAVRAVEVLVADERHRGRRGELLRMLGDLHRRSGDCPRAVDAYTRALAQRLSDRDRTEVVKGRDRCAAK